MSVPGVRPAHSPPSTMKHRRSASIVKPLMEELNQIPPDAMSPLLPAPGPGVIKYNVCLQWRQTLYFITRTALFAWWSPFERKFIPPEALSSSPLASVLGVKNFNVCSHCEQTLKFLTSCYEVHAEETLDALISPSTKRLIFSKVSTVETLY